MLQPMIRLNGQPMICSVVNRELFARVCVEKMTAITELPLFPLALSPLYLSIISLSLSFFLYLSLSISLLLSLSLSLLSLGLSLIS
jgi:hypothetical protein